MRRDGVCYNMDVPESTAMSTLSLADRITRLPVAVEGQQALHPVPFAGVPCRVAAQDPQFLWHWQGVRETYGCADMAKDTVQEQGPCHSRNRQQLPASALAAPNLCRTAAPFRVPAYELQCG